jgi:hypothetical protein
MSLDPIGLVDESALIEAQAHLAVHCCLHHVLHERHLLSNLIVSLINPNEYHFLAH